jgi:hypothetical protein
VPVVHRLAGSGKFARRVIQATIAQSRLLSFLN